MTAIAQCRKIHLPLLDSKGYPVTPDVVNDVLEEYQIIDAGGTPYEAMQARIRARGQLVDCGRTLRAMVARSRDPQRGMDFEEMREIGRLVDKIEAVPIGGHLYLDEAEYRSVCERTAAAYVVEYNKGLHTFLEALHAAPTVGLAQVLERTPEREANAQSG